MIARIFADEARPCDVVEARIALFRFCPYVEQDKVSLLHALATVGPRFEMWVAAVSVHSHDRSVLRQQILTTKSFENPLRHFEFIGAAIADALSDHLERLWNNSRSEEHTSELQ